MSRKVGLGIDVLSAAQERIRWTFDRFEKIYVSFSGGKDSTVMLHLVMDEAKKRKKKVGVLFIDLEAQYKLTIDHISDCFEMYADHIEPHWLALPISLRNAVSQFEPKWTCWDPSQKNKWVRNQDKRSITDSMFYPFFKFGMEFEELIPQFGEWYSEGRTTACFVGIRSDESLNRFRTLIAKKTRMEGKGWTTWCGGPLWNIYPIYDWKNEDLWTWHGRNPGAPYNKLYDRMRQAGLTLSQMRICQPYGDDQRKGLWLYQIIEPETWGRVVSRVNGANSGALYAKERGNITGSYKVEKPDHHSWESYSHMLLESMPPQTADHYRDKIAVFLKWWTDRGYPNGIPDEALPADEAARKVPSWRRICKTLLRNDYWCKGLSFTQTKSESFERYRKIMKRRREEWGIFA